MKYYIVDNDDLLDTVEEVLDYCIEGDYHEGDDYFEDWVDDRYDGTEINGRQYTAYEIISNINDNNWEELRDEYCREQDNEDREVAERELIHGQIGDEFEVQAYTVRLVDDDFGNEEEDPPNDYEEEPEDKEMERGIIQIIQTIGG